MKTTSLLERRLVYGLLLMLSIVLGIGNLSAQTTDTLVNLGTHQLNFTIKKGRGLPILFESGGGNDGSVWTSLIDSLYPELNATMISYGRAGNGKSEINPTLSDDKKGHIDNTVNDLQTALIQLGFNEIIIVAHSYGGFTAKLLANKNPDLVKGIVLIDANLSCYFDQRMREKYKGLGTAENLAKIKELGLGLYYEALAFDRTISTINEIKFPDNIPVLDIVAENPPNGFNDEKDAQQWLECHKEFVDQNVHVSGFVAKDCGHYVFHDDPEVVQQAIISMYNKVNRQANYKDYTYNGNEKDIQAILQNIKNFSSFYKNGDNVGIANSYTTDGKIFPNNQNIVEGTEDLSKWWKLPDGFKTLEHCIYPEEITIVEDTAYDYGIYEGASINSKGNLSNWKGKYVIVWKKVNGDWKIYLDIWNRIP